MKLCFLRWCMGIGRGNSRKWNWEWWAAPTPSLWLNRGKVLHVVLSRSTLKPLTSEHPPPTSQVSRPLQGLTWAYLEHSSSLALLPERESYLLQRIWRAIRFPSFPPSMRNPRWFFNSPLHPIHQWSSSFYTHTPIFCRLSTSRFLIKLWALDARGFQNWSLALPLQLNKTNAPNPTWILGSASCFAPVYLSFPCLRHYPVLYHLGEVLSACPVLVWRNNRNYHSPPASLHGVDRKKMKARSS